MHPLPHRRKQRRERIKWHLHEIVAVLDFYQSAQGNRLRINVASVETTRMSWIILAICPSATILRKTSSRVCVTTTS